MTVTLACTIVWGLLQGGSLVDRLKDFRQERDAVDTLLALAVESYIVDLDHAIRSDPAFASGTNARLAAFQVLSNARSTETVATIAHQRVVDEKQLILLKEGLADPDYNVRSECVSSLPFWRASARGEVTMRLRHALLDPMPVVRIRACASAAILGREATPCLPELEQLLRDVIAPDQHFSWGQPLGPTGDIEDYSLRGRAAAAKARVGIAGFAHDHNIYPSLDPVGRVSLALAWADFLGRASREQMRLDPEQARLCDAVAQVRANEGVVLEVIRAEHFVQLDDPESRALFEGFSLACYYRIFTVATEDLIIAAVGLLPDNASLSDVERSLATDLMALYESF